MATGNAQQRNVGLNSTWPMDNKFASAVGAHSMLLPRQGALLSARDCRARTLACLW